MLSGISSSTGQEQDSQYWHLRNVAVIGALKELLDEGSSDVAQKVFMARLAVAYFTAQA